MTRSILFLALGATLAGCPTETDSGDTEKETCTTTATTFPTQGSTTAYYRGNIEFKLTQADETATITTDIPGSQELSEDGLTVIWKPSAPLTPGTAYSATLTYCAGEIVLNFTTSELGTALADPQSLKGKTYNLALSDARVVEPANVGQLLTQYLGDVTIFVGIGDVRETELDIIGALGREGTTGVQETCDPTIDFPTASFESPHFIIGGTGSTTFDVAGQSVTIDNLNISGDFAPDGSYFGGGVLSGSIDTRALDQLVSDDAEEGAICELAAGLGIACEPCGDGAAFCLTLLADSIVAEAVSGLELVEIEGNNCMGCVDGTATDYSETCPEDPNAP